MDPVIIVGAGISGLNCARILHRAGRRVLVLEATDRIGGRVATDTVNGFRVDRGFQALQTAYPEARSAWHYPSLQLHSFFPGSMVRYHGSWHLFADPWCRPFLALASLFSGPGNFWDRLRVGLVRRDVTVASLKSLLARPEVSTRQRLERAGFSTDFIEGFFRPLFAGIFLEPDLATSSRVFDFVFRMMALGPVALPEGGIAALPAQLALSLPSTSLRLETPVAAVSAQCVQLASGLSIRASAVVVAADAPALTGLAPRQWLPTMQVAFAADRAPFSRPILGLDGDGSGPVNHLAVPSLVAPGYAPTGRHLISANVVGARARENEKTLLPAIMQQMHAWFGPDAASWHVLAIHRIEKALPVQLPGALEPIDRAIRREDGVYLAGEQRHMASLQGALRAGRRVAETVMEEI